MISQNESHYEGWVGRTKKRYTTETYGVAQYFPHWFSFVKDIRL